MSAGMSSFDEKLGCSTMAMPAKPTMIASARAQGARWCFIIARTMKFTAMKSGVV